METNFDEILSSKKISKFFLIKTKIETLKIITKIITNNKQRREKTNNNNAKRRSRRGSRRSIEREFGEYGCYYQGFEDWCCFYYSSSETSPGFFFCFFVFLFFFFKFVFVFNLFLLFYYFIFFIFLFCCSFFFGSIWFL